MEQIETNHGQSAFIETRIGPNGFIGEAYLGNKFYIIDASGPIWVKTNNTSEIEFKQGQGQQFSKQFKRVELRNKSATNTIFVKIWVGFGDYIDRRFQLIESSTSYVANALTSIAATTAEIFNGVPSGSQIQRKSLYVSNNDSSNNLEIRDKDNVSGLIVFPKTAIVIPTSDEVEVYNPTGGGVACRVSEIWYTT